TGPGDDGEAVGPGVDVPAGDAGVRLRRGAVDVGLEAVERLGGVVDEARRGTRGADARGGGAGGDGDVELLAVAAHPGAAELVAEHAREHPLGAAGPLLAREARTGVAAAAAEGRPPRRPE